MSTQQVSHYEKRCDRCNVLIGTFKTAVEAYKPVRHLVKLDGHTYLVLLVDPEHEPSPRKDCTCPEPFDVCEECFSKARKA